MSTLQMLDVAIGMILVYLLLSFICSAVNEFIEGILKKRSSDLRRGIGELIQDNKQNNLLEKFYNHPLIYGLYEGKYDAGSSKNLPSYITSKNFSVAILDIILPASPDNLSGAAGGGSVGKTAGATDSDRLVPLRNAILKWTESDARQSLLTLVDAGENNIDKARENIEAWYDSSMDRVSGWYKRRVQRILMALGFLISIAMNADTIAIFKSLMNDPILRNSLVTATSEYAKGGSAVTAEGTLSPEQRVSNNIKKLNELRLPIGWDWKEPTDKNDKNYITNYYLAIPSNIWWFLLKVVGWMLSALAISLGASFWFDLLNKMMVIRSTVKPHEKSQEEDSEDRQKKKRK